MKTVVEEFAVPAKRKMLPTVTDVYIEDIYDKIPEKIPLWAWACMHTGSVYTNYELAIKYRDWALKNNALLVGVGDNENCGCGTSRGRKAQGEQHLNNSEQIDHNVNYLEPLVEEGLVVGLFDSNHSDFVKDDADISPTHEVCKILGIPYLNKLGAVVFHFKDFSYVGAFQHGKSASQNPKLDLNKLQRNVQRADFYVMAHTHQKYQDTAPCSYVKIERSKTKKSYFKKEKPTRVRAGTLYGYSEYAQDALYELTDLGNSIIYLYSKEKIISPNTSDFIEMGRS